MSTCLIAIVTMIWLLWQHKNTRCQSWFGMLTSRGCHLDLLSCIASHSIIFILEQTEFYVTIQRFCSIESDKFQEQLVKTAQFPGRETDGERVRGHSILHSPILKAFNAAVSLSQGKHDLIGCQYPAMLTLTFPALWGIMGNNSLGDPIAWRDLTGTQTMAHFWILRSHGDLFEWWTFLEIFQRQY